MNKFFFWIFLQGEGRRIWLPRWFFTVIKVLFLALVVVVTIYTVNLVLTLPERTTVNHVHAHAAR